MTHDDPLRELLSGLEAPTTPQELEARALAAAGRALGEPATQDPWERLATNRRLRLAWATSVLVLVGGHLALSLAQYLHSGPPRSVMVGRPGLSAELATIAALPSINPATVSWEPDANAVPADPGRPLTDPMEEIHQ